MILSLSKHLNWLTSAVDFFLSDEKILPISIAPILLKLEKIDKLEESMHEMKSDVNVIKNDIGTIKDRLDKLEEKTNF